MNTAPINALPINAWSDDAEGGVVRLTPAGLELSNHGTALQVMRGMAGAGLSAQALGVPEVKMAISPEGLQMAAGGTAIARYNTALKANGLEMAAAGMPLALSIVQARGDVAIELGAHRVRQGVDVELGIDGLEMPLHGLHMALAGMQPKDVMVLAPAAQPMQLGLPEVRAGGLLATAAEGGSALVLGSVRANTVSYAAGAAAVLELGEPAFHYVVKARGRDAMALGMPSVVLGIAIPGLEMATGFAASAGANGSQVVAGGTQALELGEPQTLGQTARARQHFPLVLGQPSIVGHWIC